MVAETSELVRRLYQEVRTEGRLDIADELYVADSAAPAPNATPGSEGAKQHIAMIRRAFPDLAMTAEEVVAGSDSLAVRWSLRGTDTGEFLGRPPTERRVDAPYVDFLRLRDGKIASGWVGVDRLGMMVQLGRLASPWEPEPI